MSIQSFFNSGVDNVYFRSLVAAAMGLAAVPAHSAVVYADFLTINPISEVATGVLGGVTFTLQATRAVPRPFSGDNGGIVGGVTNGTSPLFSLNFFTPPQLLGDAIVLGAMPLAFSLISGDGDLRASAGNTAIQGIVGSFDDANGTLFFNQTVSDISWTSSGAAGNTAEDGIAFQMSVSQPSVVPEPPVYLLVASAFAIMIGCRRRTRVFGRASS